MTSVIANDTLEGLPSLGTDIGDFMGNLAPGLGQFIIVMAIFLGIAGVIGAVIYVIRGAVKKNKM